MKVLLDRQSMRIGRVDALIFEPLKTYRASIISESGIYWIECCRGLREEIIPGVFAIFILPFQLSHPFGTSAVPKLLISFQPRKQTKLDHKRCSLVLTWLIQSREDMCLQPTVLFSIFLETVSSFSKQIRLVILLT
jgi:hypothetical protein